jgi:hypothetical protein
VPGLELFRSYISILFSLHTCLGLFYPRSCVHVRFPSLAFRVQLDLLQAAASSPFHQRSSMARPPPLALDDAGTSGDHSDWQVVLSDPSKRRVVLYSRNLNRLSIEPTPPPSPSLTGSTRRRRGWRRRSWSGLSSLEGSSDGEGAGAAGAPPESTSSPLARAAAAAVRKHGRDTDDDDENDEDGQQRSGGGRPSSRQHSLTDAVPESVCPLCFQILPPPPPPLPLPSSSAPPTTTGSASPATNGGRSRNPKQKRTRHKRLFPLLPPPAGFLAAAAADHHHQSSDPGTESDRTTAAESRSSRAVVAGDVNAGTSYFELLSEANSLVNTPMSTGGSGGNARIAPAAAESPDHRGKAKDEGLDSHQMNEGYYARFFDEVSLLGESLEDSDDVPQVVSDLSFVCCRPWWSGRGVPRPAHAQRGSARVVRLQER